MPKLLNKETGQRELVDDVDVAAALASGKYAAPEAVAVHRFGQDTYAAPDVAAEDRVVAPEVSAADVARAQGHQIREDRNTGLAAGAEALLGGAVAGGTLGFVNPFAEAQEFHRTLSGAGALAGQIGLAEVTGAGALGGAVADSLGGGLAARVAGGVAEGGLFGGAQGVTEIALSNDPLTAEHVASTLGSNLLLGGAIGGLAGAGAHLVQRGLARAGERLSSASAARAALGGIPEDLAGLDDAGLAAARKTAVTEHAASIDAEKQAIEAGRVTQRAELAKQIRALHDNLMDERPIFHAVSGEDVGKVDGIKDIRVQLARSFKSMRSGFDSEISVARDPSSMIRPLEMRQAALEKLQGKVPELIATLGDDERAAALVHVDDALAETKQQISDIRALHNRTTPLASERLSMLEAGPSERIQQIDAARAALKNAPELGLVGKSAKAAAFGGGTALAHMIPGVGIAAPFLGKAAGDAVERLFQRMAGTVGKASEKAAGAAEKFLTASRKLEPYVAPAASKVLSAVRFGASKAEEDGGDLGELYRRRTGELYQQTMRQPDGSTVMRPEARAAMAAKLDPIRHVNPLLADKIETVQARKTAYLAHVAPKKPDPPALQIGPDRSRPPDMEIRRWAREVRATEDPESVEERLARGTVTPEEARAYRAVYPERFAALQREIFAAAPLLDKTLPMSKKVALSLFTGIPVTPAMQPNVLAVLQATFDVEPGSAGGTQAPRPQPNFGAMGSLKDTDKPTPAQQREGAGV